MAVVIKLCRVFQTRLLSQVLNQAYRDFFASYIDFNQILGNIKDNKNIIKWFSKILRDFKSNSLVANSFIGTGIIQNDKSKYHSPLRHILAPNEEPLNVLDDLTESDDSYSVDDLTEVLTENDKEQIESKSKVKKK